MTMYVRTTVPMTITVSSQDHEDDIVIDSRSPYKVLPLWAAQRPEFQELWDEGKVEVATDTDFENIITSIPASELGDAVSSVAGLSGEISASSLRTALSINNVDNTSDATKNAASVTLSNKTIASPTLTGTTAIAQSGAVELYNTADQTTNFEKVVTQYTSNIAEFGTLFGGSGTTRSLRLGVAGTANAAINRYLQLNATMPYAQFFTATGATGSMVQVGGTGTAASGNQTLLSISPTINQSGTAGYTGLLINPTETATGSGNRRLIEAQVGGTTKFAVNTDGTTIHSTGGQTQWYNTIDQTTNFERVRAFWASNIFSLSINVGGTGVRRTMRLNDYLWVNGVPTAVDATNGSSVAALVNSGSPNAGQLGAGGTLSASSGVQYSLSASPTINQSGTAGYTALLINPTETATGSGTKRLIDAQVGGSSRFSVDNTGLALANSYVSTKTSTATAAGTTTLTVASSQVQEFTGTTTQTVLLPTTSVVAGMSYTFINNSTGTVTVQSSDSSVLVSLTAGRMAVLTAKVDTPTTAAHWVNTMLTPSYGASIFTSVLRDANANVMSNNFLTTKTATATAAGTTTLTIGSARNQEFTGTTTQTVRLPTTSVVAGTDYRIINNSTGAVTVQSSGGNTVATVTAGTLQLFVAQVDTPTTAAHWRAI